LPDSDAACVFKRRVAGVGSLGRARIVALAMWEGGAIAREAKAWAPSAALWHEGRSRLENFSPDTVERAVRAQDPFLMFRRRWTVRRLSPDCQRIDLVDLARDREERRLLDAMGAETANVHLGEPRACGRVLRHLRRQDAGWLRRAAEAMADTMVDDWRGFGG
jgi:hypothetical protein